MAYSRGITPILQLLKPYLVALITLKLSSAFEDLRFNKYILGGKPLKSISNSGENWLIKLERKRRPSKLKILTRIGKLTSLDKMTLASS